MYFSRPRKHLFYIEKINLLPHYASERVQQGVRESSRFFTKIYTAAGERPALRFDNKTFPTTVISGQDSLRAEFGWGGDAAACILSAFVIPTLAVKYAEMLL